MDEWNLINMDKRSAHMHQAIEEVLLDEVGSGERKPTLRIWDDKDENIMLGRFQSVENEVYLEKVKRDDLKVSRRITGGGAMYTEPGCQITYSLYLPEDLIQSDNIKDSYKELDIFAINALRELGYDASHQPINDIVSPDGKIGGAAQTRKNGAVLHHTRIAYKMNVESMVEYLRIGEEKIKDKAIKSAEKGVNPLYKQDPSINRSEVIDKLIEKFSENKKVSDDQISKEELASAEELVENKFSTDEWLFQFE